MSLQPQKSILVTGGAGYIGSAIVQQLIGQKHRVVIYDDLSCGREDKIHPDAVFVKGDVLDIDALQNVFAQNHFDVIIHCAAKKVMNESEQNPKKYYTNNVMGTLNILSCMETYGVPKIIFSSTAAVYSPTIDAHPVVETDVVNPASAYGRSKLMAEMLIMDYARLKKIASYIILRYFNVAGDIGLRYMEINPQGVFPLLASACKNKEPFNVFGTEYATKDGSAVRDYIHLHDLASAHMLALEEQSSFILNLGTSRGYTVFELINEFEVQTGKDIEVLTKPPRVGDVPVMLANASRASELLQWTPVKTLSDMVQSTVDLYELRT
jgi:UDP-glucose 4-epimerase